MCPACVWRRWRLQAQHSGGGLWMLKQICEGGYRYEDAFNGSTTQGRNPERVARGSATPCLRRRRNTRDAPMRWRGCVRSCRGFGLRRSTNSKPTRGMARSRDLFRGRSQLPCVPPHVWARLYCCVPFLLGDCGDGFNGIQIHLAHHDVMLWAVSRGQLAKLHAYKRRMGWKFPWASSNGSDFQRRLPASVCTGEEQQREGRHPNTTIVARARLAGFQFR